MPADGDVRTPEIDVNTKKAFGLYTPGGTIHGDSYLIGDFAMSLGLTTSDTVTIFKGGEIQRDVLKNVG